jgi:hypothetical protein
MVNLPMECACGVTRFGFWISASLLIYPLRSSGRDFAALRKKDCLPKWENQTAVYSRDA